MIGVFTGPRHSGKTTRLAALCREWRAAGRAVDGYLSVAVGPGRAAQDDDKREIDLTSLATENHPAGAQARRDRDEIGAADSRSGNRSAGAPERGREDNFRGGAEAPAGYDLFEIKTGGMQPFLLRAGASPAHDWRHDDWGHVPPGTCPQSFASFRFPLPLSPATCPPSSSFDADERRVGRWVVVPAGLARAREIIRRASPEALLVVDEFGRLELEGGGVRSALDEALRTPGRRALVVVREELREAFLEMHPAAGILIYEAGSPGVGEAMSRDFFGGAS